MSYPLYIFFGLIPSIIWLSYFLRKDVHPESNRMILKIFFYGFLAALPAAFIEFGIFQEIRKLTFPPVILSFLNIFIGIALIEEILKYLVVRQKVLGDPEFDEPTDAMLYMIIAALGFAALENLLILFPLGFPFLFFETLTIALFRFVGATFLHALCSGVVGFFLALSLCYTKKRTKLLFAGLGLATFLHGLYNYSIMKIEGDMRFILPVIILIFLVIFVSFGFQKVKKLASICKIR